MCNGQYNYILFLIFLITAYSCNDKDLKSSKNVSIRTITLNEIDGSYIYSTKDSTTIVKVEEDIDSTYYIHKGFIKKNAKQQFTCKVNNADNDSFSFSLIEEYKTPKAIYEPQDRLFVTSDIEGNFNAFYSLLIGNKIMDKDFNWTFGNGHLVIVGDMVDRGSNVIPCLWLLYKLEQDAKNAGGQVHYILGNHDVMTIQLDLRYVQSKYIDLAKAVSKETDEKRAYKYLMSNTNELIKWIKSKNAIERIGNNLFLHGGISEEAVDAGLSIQKINDYVRKHIHENLIKTPGNDEYANLVFGRKGPLWYRGLVKDDQEHYKKINSNSLDNILQFYNVEHIIIGHTIIEKEVSSDFNGRVIRVDIIHSTEKFTGKSQALLIEKGSYFKVNDSGDKTPLDMITTH